MGEIQLYKKNTPITANVYDVLFPRTYTVSYAYTIKCLIVKSPRYTAISTYHGVNVQKLIKQHQFDCNERIVICPYVSHVVVKLAGNPAQLGELVMARNDSAGIIVLRAVPFKMV